MRHRAPWLLVAALGFNLASTLVHAAVGRTPGSIGVSQIGDATYEIPIWMPPGPKGVQPNLSLRYSSGGGDATMGPGWALVGLSSITRCSQTYAQDSSPAPVTLNYSDKLCLRGNRLRLTSGTYGYDLSTYQTEVADFSKVTAYGATGNGPTYFKILGKDGLTYEYGYTTDSRVAATSTSTPYSWALDKITDRQGNTLTVTYSQSDGSFVPTIIQYTRTSSTSETYTYSVNFSYNTLSDPDIEYSYVAGGSVQKRKQLATIDVQSNGASVRKYNFSYTASPATGRKRLASIQECGGSAGSDCLSPTTFTYQSGTVGIASSTSATLSPAINTLYENFADVNGDGRDDFVYTTGYATNYSTTYVQIATGTGFASPIDVGMSIYSYVTPILVDDFDGDGKLEIMSPVSGTWYVYRWNGSGFTSLSLGLAIDSGRPLNSYQDFTSADVNGDGLPDLLSMRTDGKLYVRLNSSSAGSISFSSTVSTVFDLAAAFGTQDWTNGAVIGNYNTWMNRSTLKHQDFNGDGRQDLFVRLQSGLYRLVAGPTSFSNGTYSGGSLPIDWNGDSCTDLASSGHVPGSYNAVYISACNGNEATYLTFYGPGTGGSSNTSRWQAAMDVDGDGRMDLVSTAYDGSVWLVRSTGGGAATQESLGFSVGDGWLLPVDNNGDRLGDLAYLDFTTSPYTISVHSNTATSFPDLLSSISDGYGVTHNLSYASIAQSNYTRGSGAPAGEMDIQNPMYVLTQLISPDGIGGTYTRTYNYSGARQNIQGRGFESFQSIAMTDSRTDAQKVITYYSGTFPYTRTVTQQDVYQHNATTLISSTVNAPALITLDATANNQRYFPYVSASTTQSYEVGGTKNGQLVTTASKNFTYDNYGNAINVVSTITDKDSGSPYLNQQWSSTVASTISPDTANWCLGLPTQVAVTNTAPSTTNITRTVSYSPEYSNCRITQKIVEPYSPMYKVTTAYGFDSFGNVNSEQVTGVGMTARTTTASWGTTGQFPVSVTNALSQTIQAGYDYDKGLLTSRTDPNGLVTSWQYDNFGRKTRETFADGTYIMWAYNDCASAGGCLVGTHALALAHHFYGIDNSIISDGTDYFDPLDRALISNQHLLVNGAYARNEVRYDSLGRESQEAMPCRWVTVSTACSYWTTYTYDALNRVTVSSRPISATNSTPQTTTYQYLGRTTIVTDAENKQSTKIATVVGTLGRSQDHNGYYQNFGYDAFGSLKSVTDSQSNTLFVANYVYGVQPFRTLSFDMNMGTYGYTPNALGEVVAYTDPKGTAFSATYDALSRPLTRFEPGDGTTTWTWGNSAAAHNIGQLYTLSSTGGTVETYTYDAKGRLSNRNIAADATYNYDYTYNSITGLLDTLTYPTSTSSYRLKLQYLYQNGFLQKVKDYNASTVFWQANFANARNQVTQATLGNGIVANRSYDDVTGWLSSIQCGITSGACSQNQSYLYDKVGNVIQRQNNNLGRTENFYYDNVYRLEYSQINGTTNLDPTYDALGNITARADLNSGAAWVYDSVHKHQVRQAGWANYTYDANGNMVSRGGYGISWTSYNYPKQINGAGETINLYYDANRQRYKQVYTTNGSTETTMYVGGLLQKVSASGTDDYRHQIYADGQLVAIMSRSTSGTNATRYVLTDHQGSVAKITNSDGSVYVSESFTAFGTKRNPLTWSGVPTYGDVTAADAVTRDGYTGQTALGNLGLIHMNGRVLDVITGRFLSGDPYITEPGNTQNYNRYSYVYNNPLSYVDPSGFCTQEELWHGCTNFTDGSYGSRSGMSDAGGEKYTGPGTVVPRPVDYLPGVNWEIINSDGSSTWKFWLRVESDSASFQQLLSGDSGTGPIGGTNSGGGLGQELMNTIVPGAYLAGQSQLAWQQGRYGSSAALYAGALGEAALGVFTLGESSAMLSATRVAARGTTTLYRAVSTAEHADIAATGALRVGPNSFSTGKWFWESAEHAATFGTKMDGAGNFRIIEATFPHSAADQFMRLDRLDGIGPARFGTFEQLGSPSLKLWSGSP